MSEQSVEIGKASGHHVWPGAEMFGGAGKWSWNAYGRLGSRTGHADTKKAAEAQAQAAERKLNGSEA